jgi:hypothetical protein
MTFKKGTYQGFGFKKGNQHYKLRNKRKHKIIMNIINKDKKRIKHQSILMKNKWKNKNFKNKMIKIHSHYWKHKKFSKKHKINLSKNSSHYWKNRKLSKKIRIKMSLNHANFSNNKNPNWQGGKSFEPYSKEWKRILKENIRKRDKYTCQLCKINEKKLKRRLCIHHINYNKKDCSENNLISLCLRCHMKTNYNRKEWIIYFKK